MYGGILVVWSPPDRTVLIEGLWKDSGPSVVSIVVVGLETRGVLFIPPLEAILKFEGMFKTLKSPHSNVAG